MKFLIDPISDQSISYDQFANDLQSRQVVSLSESSPSSQAGQSSDSGHLRLYHALLGQIRRWIEVDSLAGLKLTELAFDDPQRLQYWRRLFLDSNQPIQIGTSGSSGQVKYVRHTIESLTRGIKLDPRHRDDIWGWAYPAGHLAGIQVLFQAMLNHNPLVCLYQQSPNVIHQALERYAITHFSCTPTMLRILLAERWVHPNLLRLTSGGEKLDGNLLGLVGQMFPQARITNIYAATETGTLLVSHDDRFSVPLELKDQIRVQDGELWLHQNLKLDSYQSKQGLEADADQASSADQSGDSGSNPNAGKTSSEPSLASADGSVDEGNPSDSFWGTGDLVEVLAEDPLTIRFVGRRHEWFNVAGFRVDPARLERIADGHPEIAQSRFYAIPNSITENLIGCELVLKPETEEFDSNAWKQWFAGQVQRQEIPRFVRIVERILTTESGKVQRN